METTAKAEGLQLVRQGPLYHSSAKRNRESSSLERHVARGDGKQNNLKLRELIAKTGCA